MPATMTGIGPALLPSLRFSVGGDSGVVDRVHWKLDGRDVTSRAYLSKGRLVFEGTDLPDGPHLLLATVAGGFHWVGSFSPDVSANCTTMPSACLGWRNAVFQSS